MTIARMLTRFLLALLSCAVLDGALSCAASASSTVSARPAVAALESLRTVDMRSVPQARFAPLARPASELPFLVGAVRPVWYQRKAAARFIPFAPHAARTWAMQEQYGRRQDVPTPTAFNGMADSASICPYYSGCQPPDIALAASSGWELQGVNTSFAVFDPNGNLAPGWPKTIQAFFNVPNPGTCDPNGPFLSGPRAFYDPIDGRFWVAALQVEGAFGLNFCQEKSAFWVAVSQTSDPSGAWNIYSFNMRMGTTNVADFAQIGLDATAFYFGGNMFDVTGSVFKYDEIFAANRALMEAGRPVTPRGLKDITFGSTLVDTLQPVLVEGTSPAAGLFIASSNIKSGGGNCLTGCTGVQVFAMANALGSPTLTSTTATTMTYALAPLADQPTCLLCIETFDTRISATPVYAGGLITFALETGASNGSSVVPAIMWGQVKPVLSGNVITGATTTQNGLLSFAGDQAASFGAMMPDAANNMLMVFDSMSSKLGPSIEFATRLSTDPAGMLQPPAILKHAQNHTNDSRWGEYAATGYEGATTNRIWISSQYAGRNADWSTYIGVTHF